MNKMSSKICLLISFYLFIESGSLFAAMKHEPVVAGVFVDQLEVRDAEDGNPWLLDMQAWLGKDLNKLWIKTDLERVDGEIEEAELQVLYSHAVSTYWDFQIGARRDFKPSPSRDWAVLGFQGLSPYFFEIDTTLFIGQEGRAALRLEAEYDLLFTQKLILSPEIAVNFYGQKNEEKGLGSGLSDSEFGLRLRYEIRRELAPYVGVSWEKLYGESARYAEDALNDTSETSFVIGIRAWL